MTAPSKCPICHTPLDENGRQSWPEYLATATIEHSDSRCLAVVIGQRDEALTLLQDCAVNQQNPDTCGVCGEHFADCDAERACYELGEPDFPACAGGRARAAFERLRGGRG